MKLIDITQLSLRSFINRRSRIVLTMLGVAVGISVIMFLVSVGYGLQRTILDRITTAEALLTLDVTTPDDASIVLNDDMVASLSDKEFVQEVSPRTTVPARMRIGNLNSETTAHIITPNYFELAGLDVAQGESFEEAQEPGVVVSTTVGDLLGIEADALLGTEISFQLHAPGDDVIRTLPVLGILGNETTENLVFMPQSVLESSASYDLIKVQADEQKNLQALQEQLTSEGYVVSALSDLVAQAEQVFTILQVILSIFGIFSLLVAAIGLLNTMTISLLERTNEIGIMRALGATKRDIRTLFLIESSLIGLSGGIVGLIVGALGGLVFNVVLNIIIRALGGQSVDVFATPFWFIILVLAISIVVGFLSGFFPARRASRLNTLEALRYK